MPLRLVLPFEGPDAIAYVSVRLGLPAKPNVIDWDTFSFPELDLSLTSTNVTIRTRELLVSPMKMLPQSSTATPWGLFNLADVAAPPSPEKPDEPVLPALTT